MSKPYRIILTEDHPLFRQGVREILRKEPSIEVVGEAGDGLELLHLLNWKHLIPDLVILDISMPRLSGIEVTRQIKRTHPEIKVLILTMHESREYFDQAMAAGAEGYLLKEDSDTDLLTAIETIRQGAVYVSPALSGDIIVKAGLPFPALS